MYVITPRVCSSPSLTHDGLLRSHYPSQTRLQSLWRTHAFSLWLPAVGGAPGVGGASWPTSLRAGCQVGREAKSLLGAAVERGESPPATLTFGDTWLLAKSPFSPCLPIMRTPVGLGISMWLAKDVGLSGREGRIHDMRPVCSLGSPGNPVASS